ncbi:FtsX-like permease family protein [Demequina sp.]|uniref:FtsX-like permease family protein n=1 Tax=Demequina sp. TaxID=2050685 RepID=UPI003A87A0A4
MKPAAARLLLLNGSRAYGRLAGIVVGVAAGTAMMLILLAAYLHLPERDARAAWLTPDGFEAQLDDEGNAMPRARDDAAMIASPWVDVYEGQAIEVLRVAVTDDTTVEMPAGLAAPRDGEFYASPAVIELLEAAPDDQLADRWGTLVGQLPPSMLLGGDQLAVLAGDNWESLDAVPQSHLQEQMRSTGVNATAVTFRIVIAMGAIALLVPIVLLISIVGGLGAAQRREQLSTVRLIGAGRRAVAAMSAAEMAVATGVGALLGVGAAWVLRPVAAALQVNGASLTVADVSAPWPWAVATVVAVTAVGSATAYWRAFRDDVGALGAARERPEAPVTAWRSGALLAGLVLFAASAAAIRWVDSLAMLGMFGVIAGFALIAFGMVAIGPWLTRVTSVVLGRRTSSAAGVVAAGRLQRHPRATFRSVGGLVVAVFAASVFAGGSSAVTLAGTPAELPGRLALGTLTVGVDDGRDRADLAQAVRVIEAVDGVTGTVVASWPADPNDIRVVLTADDARAIGAVDVPDSALVSVDLYSMRSDAPIVEDEVPGQARAVDGAVSDLEDLEPAYLLITTDGSQAAIERARTAALVSLEPWQVPATRADVAALGATVLNSELAVMAYIGMAIAIAISALALSIAAVSAMLDRKRTFGLLRLSGMPLAHLRRTVITEAAVPLIATVALAASLGMAVAWGVLESLSDDLTLGWPDGRYWAALAVSLAVAAIGIGATLSTVRRSTEVESTRFE